MTRIGALPSGVRSGCGRIVATCAVAMLAGAFAPPALARDSSRPADARVVGTFKMNAVVTQAVHVRGERRGQHLVRIWKIAPEKCDGSVCQLLRLNRERSASIHDRLTLKRVGPGTYVGRGGFYLALSCQGRVYRHGSWVPYRITLTVHRATDVQGVRFARGLTARYTNTHRTDSTPCPLGPSHDAGRYTGEAISPPPQPPQAGFIVHVDAQTDTGAFNGQSQPGSGGGAIVSRRWQFGDPASGAANGSSRRSPSHHFSAPGVYRVRLTVVDSNGLHSTATQEVTAPGPPQADFSETEDQANPATFNFQDQSTSGYGGAAIVSWQWNFGDPGSPQNSSTAKNPSHTFSAPGTYTVTLTVTDANGYRSTRQHQVQYS